MYLHGITQEYAMKCFRAYADTNTTLEDHRTKVGKKDFYPQAYAFYMEHLWPLKSKRIEQLACWMLMSGEFVPATEWALPQSGGTMDWKRANSLNTIMCMAPDELTERDILPLFFQIDRMYPQHGEEDPPPITMQQFEHYKLQAQRQRERNDLPNRRERIQHAFDVSRIRNVSDVDDMIGKDLPAEHFLSRDWVPEPPTPTRAAPRRRAGTNGSATSGDEGARSCAQSRASATSGDDGATTTRSRSQSRGSATTDDGGVSGAPRTVGPVANPSDSDSAASIPAKRRRRNNKKQPKPQHKPYSNNNATKQPSPTKKR